VKKIVERLWATRRLGGWVFQRSQLLDALKKGAVLEYEGIFIGTRELRKLLALMPDEDCLVRANGRLEIENIERVVRTRNGKRRSSFVKPRHSHQWFGLVDKAWVPPGVPQVVAIRPRKY